ncbi:hypothetical protein [Mycolicibacterium mageritense]|uniref:hypothetical protein n=1 Tax=Mycolicibacterium mageritense TaxID=53462 RepID=UPI001E3D5E73|nr:hypothetical protein [Mycolicibacterium mageritense]GJJ23904.1 hypothetical protein MTY414_75780 [Mycolicibacterium mageritense]
MATYVDMINNNVFFRSLGGGTSVIVDCGFMSAFRSGGFLYCFSALAAILAVIRYTRADEDTGRTELLRAGVVSRFAALSSALLVAGSVVLVGGGLTTVAMIAVDLEPFGSIAYGAAITAAGWSLGSIAAVVVQLVQNASTAKQSRCRSTQSPTSCGTQRSLVADVHVPDGLGSRRLAVPVRSVVDTIGGVIAMMVTTAFLLADRRDLGERLIPARRGRGAASNLRDPISLSWRLNRGLFTKWAIVLGVFALGTAGIGTIVPDIDILPAGSFGKLQKGFGGAGDSADYVDYFQLAGLLIFAHAITMYPVVMI